MNILFFLIPKSKVAHLELDNTLRQGLEKMKHHGYTAIPVIDKDGVYAGTVSEGDFLWNMVEHKSADMKDMENYLVRDILRSDFTPPVHITATMDELLLRVMDQNFVPVTDDRGVFVGIITRRDIIKYFCEKNSSPDAPKIIISERENVKI